MSEIDTRAVRLIQSPTPSPTSEFRKSHAVIIGINEYGNGIPPLRTARTDAEQLAQILTERHGYETTLLVDDVSAARLSALLQDELPQEIDKNDRLLFYFAGHGIALDGEDGPAGYLVPQDADGANRTTFLPMQMVHDALDTLDCRHCLVILDCCFSGAFRWSSTRSLDAPPSTLYRERYERFLRSPAWQVLTSAAYDEEALDVLSGFSPREEEGQAHSPFALALFDALEGQGDANGDGVLVATELYLYLRNIVEEQAETLAKHFQTPGIWPLQKHDKGEFIFLLGEPNLKPAPELTAANNPYRGLQSYDKEHAELFFGRSDLIDKLAAQVKEQPLTIVLGASGTGKSSLVKAGLVPFLIQDNEQTDAWYALPPIRPTDTPLTALAQGIDELANPSSDHTIQTTSESISTVIDEWLVLNEHAKLLLIVDQFEELVTLCREQDERYLFEEVLAELCAKHPNRFRLIVTLRSDFEPQFNDSPLLTKLKPDGDAGDNDQPEIVNRQSQTSTERSQSIVNRYVVPPMTQADLRQVIEGPASVRVLFFDPPDLADKLVDEVIQTPGVLPLLSFTLEQLYLKYLVRQTAAQKRGDIIERSLTRADYDALGGVIGSLRTRADEEYADLPDKAHRETMQRVMLRMIVFEGGELARRRVPMTELIYPNDDENQRVQEVVNRLVEARLLVKDSIDVNGDGNLDEFVEPAHDALVRAWDRLMGWQQEFGEYLSLQRALTVAAGGWNQEGAENNSGLLWNNNPRLPQLQSVLFPDEFDDSQNNNIFRAARQSFWPPTKVTHEPTWLNDSETKFVRTSVVRRANVLKRIAGITATVVIVLSGITAFAIYQQQLAITNEATALRNEATANTERDRADAKAEEADANAAEARRNAAEAQDNARIAQENEATANKRAAEALASNLAGRSQLAIRADKLAGDLPLILARDAVFTTPAVDTDRALRFALSQPYELRTLPLAQERHKGSVYSVAYNPNSQTIVSGGADGTIRLWRASDLQPLQILFGHTAIVWSVAFSSDGERIVSSGWDHTVRLWDANSGDPIATLNGHTDHVNSVAFSPDGERIVSGSDDSTVRLWDANSGDSIITFEGHAEKVNSVAFSPDGERIVSGSGDYNSIVSRSSEDYSEDYTVRLWDAISGDEIATLEGHTDQILSVAFSPDGERIVSGGGDSTVRLWDANSGDPIATLKGHTLEVRTVAFSPDGERIVSSSWDDTVRLWDANSGDPIATLEGHTEGVWSVAFSPDGARIVSGSDDSTVRLWDADSGDEITTLEGHTAKVNSAAFSPDGARIVSGSDDSTVRLWDADSGDEITTLEGHTARVNSVAFSPDGERTISGSDDSTVRLWDADSGDELATLEGHTEGVLSVAFSPDGERIVSGSGDNTIRLWNASSGDPIAILEGHTEGVNSVAFSLDGERIVSGSGSKAYEGGDNTVRLWDANSGDPIATLNGHTDHVNSVAFSPDGERIVSGSDDETVRLWDANSGGEIATIEGQTWIVNSVAFSPDGERIVSGSGDNTVRLWDADSGAPLATLEGHTVHVLSVAFSPDGERIVSSGWDNTMHLWDSNSDDEIATLNGHAALVLSVAFSPDGERIVSGSGDSTVRLWDANSGDEIATLNGHAALVLSVAFSPDGERIVSGGWDHTLRLWDASSGDEITILKGHIGGVLSVAFSPDGERIVSGGDTVRLWDANSGDEIATLNGHTGRVSSVAFSPDGERIVSGGDTVRLWDANSGDEIATLNGHTEGVSSVAFSPDGERIVSGGDTVRLWDANSGDEIATLNGHTEGVLSVAFSPLGEHIVSSSEDSTVRLWDADTGDEIATFEDHTSEVRTVAFSPDGDRIVSGGDIVRLWDGPERLLLRATLQIARLAPILTTSERQQFGIGDKVQLPGQTELQPLIARAQALQLTEEGRTLARTGANTEAVNLFEQALALDPSLDFEPQDLAERVKRNQALAFRVDGIEFARVGEVISATLKFEDAVTLDPSLEIEPEQEAKRLYAPVVVEEGRSLANVGEVISATLKFEDAVTLDPSLEIEPEQEAKQLYAPVVVEEGRSLAKVGEIISATLKFEDALALDPSLEIEPEQEAKRLYAPTVVEEGRSLAEVGQVISATLKFEDALVLDPALVLKIGDPITSTTSVRSHWLLDGIAEQAITISLIDTDEGDFDPYLTLIGPDGQTITEDDDSGHDGFDALINEITLPENGTYIIIAGREGGSAIYELLVTQVGEDIEID